MKTRIQYPLDSKQKSLDGRLHDVDIYSLTEYNINGELYYFAEYFDKTAGNKRMFTFIKKIDDILCKVPLKDYDWHKINQCLKGCPSRQLSDDEIEKVVPELIGLAETVKIEDIANSSKIHAKNVTIQYPYSQGNDHIDGNVHQISPLNVVRCSVNGFDIYYMEYYDLSLGHRMLTFLIRIGEGLYKLPLTSYNDEEMRKFIEKYGVSLVDPVSLFAGSGIPTDKPTIGLSMAMSLEDIINIKTKTENGIKTPIIEYPYYIPYNPDNPMSISDRVFRSCYRVYDENNVDYVFGKEKNGYVIDNAIREAIRANLDKIERGESFFLDIEVFIPAGTTVALPTKEGRMVLAMYVPGIHKHRIFMTPCDKKELDRPTRLCDGLSVRGMSDSDFAVTDNHEAFEGGYKGRLPIRFTGLPKEYTDRTTFYNLPEERVVQPVEEDYFANPEINLLRDFYFLSMEKILGLNGSMMFESGYAEEYDTNMTNSMIESMLKMGIPKKKAELIAIKIKRDFAKQRPGSRKGL